MAITSGIPRKADKFRTRRHFAFGPFTDSFTAGLRIGKPSVIAVSSRVMRPKACPELRLFLVAIFLANMVFADVVCQYRRVAVLPWHSP
jgi:hypothetical protein